MIVGGGVWLILGLLSVPFRCESSAALVAVVSVLVSVGLPLRGNGVWFAGGWGGAQGVGLFAFGLRRLVYRCAAGSRCSVGWEG